MKRDQEKYGRVAKQRKAGAVSENAVNFAGPETPFGGYKNSGLGLACIRERITQRTNMASESNRLV